MEALQHRHPDGDPGPKPPRPMLGSGSSQPLKVFQVGLLCTQVSLNLRPSMWKVVEMLGSGDRVLPQLTEPPFIDVKGSNAKSESSGSSMSLMLNSDKSPFLTNKLSVSGVQAT
jgi:hypothetical protein